ncbi:MAG: hypothetical protein A2X94_10905 [Bdellovibrionales bacterium GWB1_55_8]|nr:MAG: hypothetical protein A2X94_10905 [Bdellovibrionales bacterium GWB1_55_8]
MSLSRLQKIIAESGVLSRRKAEEAIVQGRVAVNGKVQTELGAKADPLVDLISVDGRELVRAEQKTILIFHKPRRVVTTKSDPEGRRTVMDYLPPEHRHLKPVGRLDFDSEGMLVFTDDGELANKLMHPSHGIRKSYRAWVRGTPSSEVLERLRKEVVLEDGAGRFESVRVLERTSQMATIQVEVSEGRNRFVRRMLEAVGHPVLRLRRTRIGQLELGDLAPGHFRALQPEEVKQLLRSGGGALKIVRK